MVETPDVTAEDQDKINAFNKFYQRLKEIEAELQGRVKEKDNCEDASNEMMLIDDDEVRFIVGECFYHATISEAEERLAAYLEDVEEEQGKLERETLQVKSKMDGLKKELYGKFGNSINLEE